MKPATRYAIITAAGLLTASILAPAAHAQTLGHHICTNGTVVPTPAEQPGLVADCRALVDIRNHWRHRGGYGWFDSWYTDIDQDVYRGDWRSSSDIKYWRGVTVSGSGGEQRVTALNGANRGVSGSIPAELGNLTALETLTLDGNDLSGSIPAELGNLTKLETLTLRNNELTGSIPAELGQLTNLETLILVGNDLSGSIPAELGNLTKLKLLGLDVNELTGTIPAELGQLTNLEILNLFDNQLTGSIPPTLDQLTNLEWLGLRNNQLTGRIPHTLGNLTKLKRLGLNHNQLTGHIPPSLGNLTKLKYLSLHNNQLTGNIPAELDQLPEIETLKLDNNCIPDLIKGRFCDDDNSTHEPNIETIAGWGITIGCDPIRYCPEATITRRQMSAFLHRAVTHRTGTEPTATDPPAINDLTAPSALPYAQWAVAAGVMQAPQGQFNPKGIVTRADMAAMMAAAFDHITPPTNPRGVFEDMTGQPAAVTRAAEALRTAGVTTGCSTSPPRYCPDQPVTRAQMASFFARALP